MRITSGIRYAPPPTLDEPWARATLAALAEPEPAPDYFGASWGASPWEARSDASAPRRLAGRSLALLIEPIVTSSSVS